MQTIHRWGGACFFTVLLWALSVPAWGAEPVPVPPPSVTAPAPAPEKNADVPSASSPEGEPPAAKPATPAEKARPVDREERLRQMMERRKSRGLPIPPHLEQRLQGLEGAGKSPEKGEGNEGEKKAGEAPPKPPSPPRMRVQQVSGQLVMNFDNADLHDVLRTFGDLLGISYVVDPRAKGTVTVQTAGRINKEDLFPLLQEVLRLNGLTAVKVGGVYEIIPFTDAKGKPVSPSVGKDPKELPGEERIVIQIARLKFLTTAEITKVLKPFLSPGGEIVEYPRSNTLLIADLSSYVKRLLEMINIFDVEEEASEESGVRTYVYSVQNGKAKDLASVLSQVFAKGPARPAPTTTAAPPAKPGAPGAPPAPAPAPAPTAPLAVPGHEGEMRIVADEVTNSLIIQAAPKEYKAVKELLKKLDIVPRQVLLEVLVAELSLADELQFGLEWAFKNRQLTYKGSKLATDGGLNFNLRPADVATITGAYFSVAQADKFAALLTSLASEDKLNVLSSPHVLASDNKTATINVSEEIPIVTQTAPSTVQEGGSTLLTTSIQYRNVGLILKVTPSINAEGLVRLDISQEDSVPEDTTVAGIQTFKIRQRKAETSAVVQAGESIVIGGLIRNRQGRTYAGLPLLSKIPVLGALFRDTTWKEDKTELLIMVTPHIIRTGDEAKRVTGEFLDRVRGLKERIGKEKEKMAPKGEEGDKE